MGLGMYNLMELDCGTGIRESEKVGKKGVISKIET